jgi:FkbM family methyltransferase
LRRAAHRIGVEIRYTRPFRDPVTLFALKARERGVRTVFDVGANIGQFARDLRARGYGETILSFEPLGHAHRALCANAARDPLWRVAPRVALGAQAGRGAMQVSANSVSSSLLAIEPNSIDVAPETARIGEEEVDLATLDSFAGPDLPRPFALKLDVQGYELEVLKGVSDMLADCALVMAEMSLTRLYAGAPDLPEVYQWLRARGFRCISITQGFADFQANELLEVDGVFIRD